MFSRLRLVFPGLCSASEGQVLVVTDLLTGGQWGICLRRPDTLAVKLPRALADTVFYHTGMSVAPFSQIFPPLRLLFVSDFLHCYKKKMAVLHNVQQIVV